ncbi:hypothetical protein D3C71_901980 [compost metagenome]
MAHSRPIKIVIQNRSAAADNLNFSTPVDFEVIELVCKKAAVYSRRKDADDFTTLVFNGVGEGKQYFFAALRGDGIRNIGVPFHGFREIFTICPRLAYIACIGPGYNGSFGIKQQERAISSCILEAVHYSFVGFSIQAVGSTKKFVILHRSFIAQFQQIPVGVMVRCQEGGLFLKLKGRPQPFGNPVPIRSNLILALS